MGELELASWRERAKRRALVVSAGFWDRF